MKARAAGYAGFIGSHRTTPAGGAHAPDTDYLNITGFFDGVPLC